MNFLEDIEGLLIGPLFGRNTIRRASGVRTTVVPARAQPASPLNAGVAPSTGVRAATNPPAGIDKSDVINAVQRRTVYALEAGVVSTVGWEKAGDHNGGMGWRIYITAKDGSRIGYGHMDPSSTLKEKTKVEVGDPIGVYADPTNGRSSGPHVHVQKFDKANNIVDPGSVSPLRGTSRATARFHAVDDMHPNPHKGTDWAAAD